MGGDENDEISFDVLINIRTEETPNQRNIANDGRFIFGLLHIFAHQPAKHDGLPVIDADAGGNLARTEHGLVYHVFSEENRHRC